MDVSLFAQSLFTSLVRWQIYLESAVAGIEDDEIARSKD